MFLFFRIAGSELLYLFSFVISIEPFICTAGRGSKGPLTTEVVRGHRRGSEESRRRECANTAEEMKNVERAGARRVEEKKWKKKCRSSGSPRLPVNSLEKEREVIANGALSGAPGHCKAMRERFAERPGECRA